MALHSISFISLEYMIDIILQDGGNLLKYFITGMEMNLSA